MGPMPVHQSQVPKYLSSIVQKWSCPSHPSLPDYFNISFLGAFTLKNSSTMVMCTSLFTELD